MGSPKEFRKQLESLINRYSQENGSHTPDFILAKYMDSCLRVFETAIAEREKWYGHGDRISNLSLTGLVKSVKQVSGDHRGTYLSPVPLTKHQKLTKQQKRQKSKRKS